MGVTTAVHQPASKIDISNQCSLSRVARDYARSNPLRVRRAIANVLEAVAREEAATIWCESHGKLIEFPKQLERFLVHEQYGDEMIGAGEAASRLNVSLATVRAWIKKSKIIGWKSSQLGLTIPQEQILGPGEVVGGIKEIVQLFGGHGGAWAFLDRKTSFEHDFARPIEKLRLGKVKEVLGAANGVAWGGM